MRLGKLSIILCLLVALLNFSFLANANNGTPYSFIRLDASKGLVNNQVTCIYKDSRGFILVATHEGLTLIDPHTNYTKIFRKENGLARDIMNCIQEDEYQSIWVSKSSGLSQIIIDQAKPDKNFSFSIYHYTEADGLQGQEFNANS